MKKVIAIIMAVALIAVSAFTVSAAAATPDAAVPASQTQQLGTGFGNYRSNTAVYQALYNKIVNSGAEGYTVAKIQGSDSYQLILSYGNCELARTYEVYTINMNDITYVGTLSGAHTTLYIDANTAKLGMFRTAQGHYAFGLVSADGGLHFEPTETGFAAAGEAYPAVQGEITLWPTTNLIGIANF